jgi:aromatic-amino-acid transaminase
MAFVIPSRSARPSDDPIFALNAEARARAQAGEKVINATVGSLLDDEGVIATLPSVIEALREVPPNAAAAYAPIAGSNDFLRGVASDLLGTRPQVDAVASAATPGGTGALRHAIANCLEPGQSLLTTSFYWGPYKTLADENDRKLETFRMFNEEGRLDVADFENKLSALLERQGRALILLNTPCQNPTGYSLDLRELKALRNAIDGLSSKGPISVCLDVAYARFGAQPLDVVVDEMLELLPRALVMFAWSGSKSFLQYGLRVGALVAVHPDPEERSKLQNALSFSCRGTWSNVNAGGMIALSRVLNDSERRARVDRERVGMVDLLAKRVARWNDLAQRAKLHYPRYDGGFFTTVFTENAHAVADKLKSDGVFVVPQAGALRVALCSVAERDIERLVTSIARHTA